MPKSIDNQDLICNIRAVLLVVVARLVEIDLAVNLSQSRFHSDGGRGSRGAAFFSLFLPMPVAFRLRHGVGQCPPRLANSSRTSAGSPSTQACSPRGSGKTWPNSTMSV